MFNCVLINWTHGFVISQKKNFLNDFFMHCGHNALHVVCVDRDVLFNLVAPTSEMCWALYICNALLCKHVILSFVWNYLSLLMNHVDFKHTFMSLCLYVALCQYKVLPTNIAECTNTLFSSISLLHYLKK